MLASVLSAERCSTMAESLRALAAGYRPISPAIEEVAVTGLNEADVEAAAVGWLAGLGWNVAHGTEVNPDAAPAERTDYSAVALAATLREALARLNPELPGETLSNAVRRLTHPEGATLEARNRAFHRMVVDGVTVEYRDDGRIRGAQARVIDFDDPANNDWLAVNQFTVVENKIERRPDVVLFVNGLPLGVIELKNPADADATIWTAWQQLQTYKADLSGLFSMNAVMMVSDGLEARLATYTESGGRGETALDQAEAVAVMQEKYEICRGLFWGFDWSEWAGGDAQARLGLLPAALEHILAQADGKDRCTTAVRELSQAFALAVPDPAAMSIRDDVAFFQAVAAALSKPAPGESRLEEDLDHAVRQIISRAVTPQGVLDIFAAAGLDKPDISVLSEEFLAEVRGLPQRNLAVEALRRLLQGEVNRRRVRNVVQARSFSEMLAQSILRYQNRAIEAAQVIEELIGLAEEIREADARGEQLGLSEEELAFYDALETNDSAVKVLGDETLRAIACELVETVRNNVTIDWTMRENVRAKLRSYVRRILRRHGYPPDKQEKATQTVLEQAEALSDVWATAA